MSLSLPQLNIVVALPCEARFFLDHYFLKKIDNNSIFDIFSDKSNQIYLIVSGVGKVKSACATSYLHLFSQADEHTSYLNAGICGGGQSDIGELFLVNKLTDSATKKSFYPTVILNHYLKSLPLRTVDIPATMTDCHSLVDMEAVGFYQAATSVVTQEHVQIIKIVSDDCSQTAIKRINTKFVIDQFKNQSSNINRIVDHQLTLSKNEKNHHIKPVHFPLFLDRWHFTTYQQHTLRELLRRWQVVFPSRNPLDYCANVSSSKKILTMLHQELSI